MTPERHEHLAGVILSTRALCETRVWGDEAVRSRNIKLMATVPGILAAMEELLDHVTTIIATRDSALANLEALRVERDEAIAARQHAMEACAANMAAIIDERDSHAENWTLCETENDRLEVLQPTEAEREALRVWRGRGYALINCEVAVDYVDRLIDGAKSGLGSND